MIKIGILGYGNLGRGVEAAVKMNSDLELVAVYTRRDPASLKINTEGVEVRPVALLEEGKEEIDVLVICGGSATDLPEMTPKFASLYNVIDSFDTHARIPEHFANVDAAAKKAGKIGIISAGWDPGMFSLNRVYADAVLPCGKAYTFWGKGVSQGHSDAVRRIEGVKDARQYTIPVEAAVDAVRGGLAENVCTLRQPAVGPPQGKAVAVGGSPRRGFDSPNMLRMVGIKALRIPVVRKRRGQVPRRDEGQTPQPGQHDEGGHHRRDQQQPA